MKSASRDQIIRLAGGCHEHIVAGLRRFSPDPFSFLITYPRRVSGQRNVFHAVLEHTRGPENIDIEVLTTNIMGFCFELLILGASQAVGLHSNCFSKILED